MNVSTTISKLYLHIHQCYFCQNGEAVEALLQMIGTHIWTEAEQLLVELLQQVITFTFFNNFALSHFLKVTFTLSNFQTFAL